MKSNKLRSLFVVLGGTTLVGASALVAAPTPDLIWQVVVNNGDTIPTTTRVYNSYNPPSVNSDALVVFRARSTGQQQGPVSGIYTRDMGTGDPEIVRILDRKTEVPQQNNAHYQPFNPQLTTFIETP